MAAAAGAQRPLPEITPVTEPFWSALREHKLVVQRCDVCKTLRFPPEVGCFECGSMASTWVEMSGRATLWSWTVGYPPLLAFFAERAPWPVVVVQLEEGPRMVTNVVDLPVEQYEFGMPLVADYEDIADDVTLVVFRSAQ
jgi:uncharacterized OB-fold protein